MECLPISTEKRELVQNAVILTIACPVSSKRMKLQRLAVGNAFPKTM